MSTPDENENDNNYAEAYSRICFWIPENVLNLSLDGKDEDPAHASGEGSNFQDAMGKTMGTMLEAKAVATVGFRADLTNLQSGENLLAEQEVESHSTTGSFKRLIYDLQFCKHPRNFPGVLMRSEGEGPIERQGDPNVNRCYDQLGIILEFLKQEMNHPKPDSRVPPIVGIVNYDFYLPNAWWGPVTFDANHMPLAHGIVFGNGFDHDPFNGNAPRPYFAGQVGNLVSSLQCVAHEVFHGVTFALQPSLESWGEPGAVGEHISDVFGTLVHQWQAKTTTEQSDWLIGEEVVLPEHKGMALKSMAMPGTAFSFRDIAKDPQVCHMDQFYRGKADKGGIHINSGILNRGFYELAKIMTGNAWEKPGQIWWAALNRRLPSNCRFQKWATTTREEAKKLYGVEAEKQVREAWERVGIKV